jgi:hypothetical protein
MRSLLLSGLCRPSRWIRTIGLTGAFVRTGDAVRQTHRVSTVCMPSGIVTTGPRFRTTVRLEAT